MLQEIPYMTGFMNNTEVTVIIISGSTETKFQIRRNVLAWYSELFVHMLESSPRLELHGISPRLFRKLLDWLEHGIPFDFICGASQRHDRQSRKKDHNVGISIDVEVDSHEPSQRVCNEASDLTLTSDVVAREDVRVQEMMATDMIIDSAIKDGLKLSKFCHDYKIDRAIPAICEGLKTCLNSTKYNLQPRLGPMDIDWVYDNLPFGAVTFCIWQVIHSQYAGRRHILEQCKRKHNILRDLEMLDTIFANLVRNMTFPR